MSTLTYTSVVSNCHDRFSNKTHRPAARNSPVSQSQRLSKSCLVKACLPIYPFPPTIKANFPLLALLSNRGERPLMEAVPRIPNKGLIASPTKKLSFSSTNSSSARPGMSTGCNVVLESNGSLPVEAVVPGVDFGEQGWTSKYLVDFEQRFKLPHLYDIFPDIKPIPSTFCLKSRRPINGDFADGYPSDERWNGYINNDDRVLLKVIRYASPQSAGAEGVDPDCTWLEQWVHRAGPREEIYFKPEEVRAAIVTCDGLCPGLNDVIRQIVITLEIYGVKKITGIQYGYRGFTDDTIEDIQLSRRVVQNIHLGGGSILGVSRGAPNISEVVDSLQQRGINMVFVLGGNGTHAGANEVHKECRKREMKVAVVGVPKTIDNDILLMDKTFGFDTAVEEAQRAINSAYIEAHSAYHGIGIVKLMGRSSGFIAMHASLASGQVDVCLIPEVPFALHGPHGVLTHLRHLVESKGSAVVCVAEGAGQNLIPSTNAKDASGNIIFGDIGVHIQQETKRHFKEIGVAADVKYIDPTYMIRAVRANASDGILCAVLGQNAVHGAFAGFSGITVGICNTHYVYVPIPEVISYERRVDPNSRMWHRCLTSTGQPDFV